MAEVVVPVVAKFSDAGRFEALLGSWGGPPYLLRIVITDSTVRSAGRGPILRRVIPTRSRAIGEVVSAEVRGMLILLHLQDGTWWSVVCSATKRNEIMRELDSRGVPNPPDAGPLTP